MAFSDQIQAFTTNCLMSSEESERPLGSRDSNDQVTRVACQLPVWCVEMQNLPNRAVTAHDLLLPSASSGVQEMQCTCRRNGLFTLFPYADKLSGAQRRRYMNMVELIGNVDRFLLIRNGARRFFSHVL